MDGDSSQSAGVMLTETLHLTEDTVIPAWVEKENKSERIDLALLLAAAAVCLSLLILLWLCVCYCCCATKKGAKPEVDQPGEQQELLDGDDAQDSAEQHGNRGVDRGDDSAGGAGRDYGNSHSDEEMGLSNGQDNRHANGASTPDRALPTEPVVPAPSVEDVVAVPPLAPASAGTGDGAYYDNADADEEAGVPNGQDYRHANGASTPEQALPKQPFDGVRSAGGVVAVPPLVPASAGTDDGAYNDNVRSAGDIVVVPPLATPSASTAGWAQKDDAPDEEMGRPNGLDDRHANGASKPDQALRLDPASRSTDFDGIPATELASTLSQLRVCLKARETWRHRAETAEKGTIIGSPRAAELAEESFLAQYGNDDGDQLDQMSLLEATMQMLEAEHEIEEFRLRTEKAESRLRSS